MLLLKGGTIITQTRQGVINRGDILIDQGRIAQIGTNIEPDEGCECIDVSRKYVIPGLIDAHSHAGLGISSEEANELTNPVQPELDVIWGINDREDIFRHLLEEGITSSCIIPGSGNVIGGWGVVFKSAGETRQRRIVKHPAVLKAAVGVNPKAVYAALSQAPMTRMAIYEMLRRYFTQVRSYMESNSREYDSGLEHGIPVLAKEIPLKVHSYQHDMMTVLDLAREFDFEITLDHAQGASDYLEELQDEHVRGIIYGPVMMGLSPGEPCKVDYEALKLLDDRGVPVAVCTDMPIVKGRMLQYQAGEAVRMGMDPERALRMITAGAAHILGCDDRIGSLSPGMDADIAVFSGYPGKDVTAENMLTIVDGQIVYRRV